ncbi:hypothetical protein OROMI_030604 [Orobanche minor]
MVPQGPPPPLGGGQPIPPSLLRSNSGMTSQNVFPSLVSPRNQLNSNVNMIGNAPNVSSLLHQSFGNGPSSSGLSGPVSSQRGLIDGGAESDPLSNGMGFNHSSSYMSPSIPANTNSSGQVQGHQQLDHQNFQHNNQMQFPVPSNPQQAMRAGGLGGAGHVKMEPQGTNEQTPQHLRGLGPLKLEPQHTQSMRGVGPIKMEPHQHSDSSLFLHQQQQHQLQSMRHSSEAAAAAQILHQQRVMQIQQQQLLKSMPQQRSPVQQTQFQQQNMPVRSPVKPVYEPGMCARRLTHYMYQQQHRAEDNNIEFWRKFVAEYFAPNATKKWCVSMYGSGRQTNGVFPQDVWHCEICNRKPGRGFEATFEVLPRLFKIKYESGTLEELLYVDMPREYQNSSGQIVLDYAKAIQESVFEQLRVVRDGQLRIVFSPDLKICSWEFCARHHEELIPRRLLIPQVSQLGAAAQKCQAASQSAAAASVPTSELQNNCNMFVASARQLAKALEVPLVNDLGYTKRYVRCLQISEVVNSMKDLIDYSRETGTGPMESLIKYPQITNPSSRFQSQSQQTEGQLQQQQQTPGQNPNNENPAQSAPAQLATNKNTPNVENTPNTVPPVSSTNTIVGLLHQNSMNSRHQTGSYGAASVQMPSPSPPSSSNNNNNNIIINNNKKNNTQPASHGTLPGSHANSPNISIPQQTSLSNDVVDANDSQSSVQKIIHDMMMSSQVGGDIKNVNGMNCGNILVENGVAANGNHGIPGPGFRSMGQSAMTNGIRAALANNNSVLSSTNGRVGMMTAREQSMSRDLGSQLFSGLGAVNGFNDLHFDWKGSP